MNKNNIISFNEKIIKKTFSDEIDYLTELYFYNEFKDFPLIPKLLYTEYNSLYIQKINGKNLYECATHEQNKLAYTLASFHNMTFIPETNMSLIHHDTNLKNYIYSDEKIYILDFSDIIIGSPLKDLYSSLLFFCEIMSPDIFVDFNKTYQKKYFDKLLHHLSNSELILNNEINRFIKRREKYNKKIKNFDWFNKNYAEILLVHN